MRYTYKAKRSPQERFDGVIDAQSRQEVVRCLAARGLRPVVVEESMPDGDARRWRWAVPSDHRPIGRPRRRQRLLLTRQLADLLGAGVTLAEALRLVAQDPAYGGFGRRLAALRDAVEEGEPFSRALAAQAEWCSPFYRHMVAAGEAGGTLPEAMGELAQSLEHEESLRSRLQASLAYPMLVVVVGVLAVVALLVVVVPRLEWLFVSELSAGRALPGPTRLVVAASRWLRRGWWLAPVVVAAGAVVGARYRAAWRESWLRLRRRLPLIGSLAAQAQVARWARTVGTLLARGVTLLEALEVSSALWSDPRLREEAAAMGKEVADGSSLSASLRRRPAHFGRFVASMVSVGEERGRLDDGLLKVAAACEREVEQATKVVLSLLEPALVLALGLVVGTIAVAMLLPIVELSLHVQ